jgi:uncharacterized phage protein gp47/JayE
MLSSLSRAEIPDGDGEGTRPLQSLTQRSTDDISIALLDAWASVLHVLGFYQDRVANEGFLRPATERLSVRQLARAIGYELGPGVAASTYVAFTVESSALSGTADLDPALRQQLGTTGAGFAGRAVVPTGTQIKSVPGPDEVPQTFETTGELQARAEWNELRPIRHREQHPDPGARVVWLDGAVTDLSARDLILVVPKDGSTPVVRRVVSVSVDDEMGRTEVVTDGTTAPPRFLRLRRNLLTYTAPLLQPTRLSKASVRRYVRPPPPLPSFELGDPEPGVYTFAVRSGAFGHNAPKWLALPSDDRVCGGAYPPDGWDGTNEPHVGADSQGRLYRSEDSAGGTSDQAHFFLERVASDVVPGGWTVLERGGSVLPLRVADVLETSLADFALSGKATGVVAKKVDGTDLDIDPPAGGTLGSFKVRSTTIHAGSKLRPLALLPVEEPVGLEDPPEASDGASASGSGGSGGSTDGSGGGAPGPEGTAPGPNGGAADTAEEPVHTGQITLDHLVLDLERGRAVAISGERHDLPGVLASEVAIIQEIVHDDANTTLFFESALQHVYVRSTVVLNANVVRATHGESVTQVLGSGDGARPHARFTLLRPPLTYVSDASPTGASSTLSVRVDDVLWDEVPTLYGRGPGDPAYQVRHEEDRTVHLTFGDGVRGSRIATGRDNVVARYRTGVGLDAEVPAGALTMLQGRPLGVRGASNPVPATGAADPEAIEDARNNAPRTVRTLDRIVSLRDYEDFAAGFAGVGKASAREIWDGQRSLVHVTVASAGGDPVDETSELFQNLVAAIDRVRAPLQPVVVGSFVPAFFNISAKVRPEPRRLAADVIEDVDAALKEAFSFARRGFGQAVTAAEVVAQIHSVDGVLAVDLDALHRVGDAPSTGPVPLHSRIGAMAAHWDGGGVALAELLLLNPAGLTLVEMTS